MPNPSPSPEIPLESLGLADGLAWGGWTLWFVASNRTAYLLHADPDWVVYFPAASNGWFNYRTEAGVWYVVCGTRPGQVYLQNRSELPIGQFLGRQPGHTLLPDRYRLENWSLEAAGDELRVFHERLGVPLVLYASRPLMTWDKKPPPGCCGG